MILASLFLWLIATAQLPSPLATSDFGVIQGTVVDPDGKPVEGAQVYALGDDNRPPTARPHITTTNAQGDFVLDHFIPSNTVEIHASKYTDYYMDTLSVYSAFEFPPKSEMPPVEVKPGQTVGGITVRLMQKAGKLHLYVRDADTKELVHGIFFQKCHEGDPPGHCVKGSAGSDFEQFVALGPGISINLEADDGLHKKWEYRDPKTSSPYFEAKSGETETVEIYLRKTK